MGATLYARMTDESKNILPLVKSAIDAEVALLEAALALAETRLRPYKQKYQICSAEFLDSWTAEDLEDGDDEYIRWAGEACLHQKLLAKLTQLREITYGTTRRTLIDSRLPSIISRCCLLWSNQIF